MLLLNFSYLCYTFICRSENRSRGDKTPSPNYYQCSLSIIVERSIIQRNMLVKFSSIYRFLCTLLTNDVCIYLFTLLFWPWIGHGSNFHFRGCEAYVMYYNEHSYIYTDVDTCKEAYVISTSEENESFLCSCVSRLFASSSHLCYQIYKIPNEHIPRRCSFCSNWSMNSLEVLFMF